MPTAKRPRRGSLQFYPRKRSAKPVPSVNWRPVASGVNSTVNDTKGLLGFFGYKVGMATAIIKDVTDKSLTAGKRVAMPVTILEVPAMKLFSLRLYWKGQAAGEVVLANDKELKGKVKVPKVIGDVDKLVEKLGEDNIDDVRVIGFSIVKQTSVKKKPDMLEFGVAGDSVSEKLEWVKANVGKELDSADFFKDRGLLDVRGLTKGKGTQGPVKRFGITLRSHKAEKGPRKVGSIGPWHPARVTFRVPMAGQMGLFSRVHYNLKVIDFASISEKDINPKSGFKGYGNIKSSFVVVKGSVQGPSKRAIVMTPAFRPTKIQLKKVFEFIGLMNKTK